MELRGSTVGTVFILLGLVYLVFIYRRKKGVMCTIGAGRSSDRYGGGATTGLTPAAGRSTEMEELVSLASQELE